MSLYKIYFSPTGGTKKVADIVADAWGGEVRTLDLIKEPDKAAETEFAPEDICFVAAPAYGGRIPWPEADLLKELKGNGAKAVLLAAYGNRAIDDTLMEMYDILKAHGFECIAGMEAVTEHSLMRECGKGRPDSEDEKQIKGFTLQIKAALAEGKLSGSPALPGSHNYCIFNGLPLTPSAGSKCTGCGLCAKECPAHAIPVNAPNETDGKLCISCMHCVSICPQGARKLNPIVALAVGKRLKSVCSGRKENRLYL